MKTYLYNMFATIQNGQIIKRSFVIQKKTKISESFLNVLWDSGFISGYKNSRKKLKIFLKYDNGIPVIKSFKTISKPSKKKYYSIKQIWKIDSSKTFLIISTSKGLKSLFECKKEKLGGEPVVTIN
uniref:Ribosomal protein S8 n=1 Tax=Asterionella formosa TaxID=210441 RepID=A0A1J0RDB3_9STRA|nr:ribosomal protein S8 [Asterionella formosa]APD75833.1 ribosomal protein S8 [Asterionella formosa]